MGGDHKGLMFPQKKRGGKEIIGVLVAVGLSLPHGRRACGVSFYFGLGWKKGGPPKGKEGKRGPPRHPAERKIEKRGEGEKRNWKREEEESSDLPHWPLDLPLLLPLSLFLPFSSLTADFFLLAWVDLFFSIMQKKYRSFVFSLPFSCCRCCCERCIYCMYPTHLFPTTSFSLP